MHKVDMKSLGSTNGFPIVSVFGYLQFRNNFALMHELGWTTTEVCAAVSHGVGSSTEP